MYKLLLLVVAAAITTPAHTQAPDSTRHQLTLSAYVDAYYAAYTGQVDGPYAAYTTVGARDNTIGLNVAQFGLHYTHDRLRANFTYHTGDIPGATWSSEFPNIQEANVGVRLGGTWWLDAGFFRTHIGAESFLPKNNTLSSTAFLTFNEPFFQAGARLSVDPSERWHLEGWLLNGYNQFVDANRAKSAGLLATYSPNEATSLTYTNLIGNEAAPDDPTDRLRLYQNAYWSQQWSERLSTLLAFDLGLQGNSDLERPDQTAYLYAGRASLHYQFDARWSTTLRGEAFNDQNGFISGTLPTTAGTEAGAELAAVTLGTEYRPAPNAYLRVESRYATHPEELLLFNDDDGPANRRWELLLTFGIDLSRNFAL